VVQMNPRIFGLMTIGGRRWAQARGAVEAFFSVATLLVAMPGTLARLLAPGMRTFLTSTSVLLLAAIAAPAATALDALRVLLPEQARNVAMITAREGTPEPDRWHVIVFDSTSESGLREYVIAGDRRVASRSVSQFVEKLSAGDVLGPAAIKVDSDRVVKTALQYGVANNKMIAALHFDLRKGATDGTPVWTVICADPGGTETGRLLISATKGEVLSHPGFSHEPPLESVAERAPATPAPDRGESNSSTRKTSVPTKAATPLPVATPKPPLFRRLFGGNPR
jgi:hypothetical protein